jgi:ABC-type antimicrobial peptide transport system permease subunit
VTRPGLTAIDLAGLTRLELAFAFVLAAAASGLVLALGLAERQRTFAFASALGAKTRQLAAFVWSEAAFVTAVGIVLGVLAGWGVSFVLVKILTGVFDLHRSTCSSHRPISPSSEGSPWQRSWRRGGAPSGPPAGPRCRSYGTSKPGSVASPLDRSSSLSTA